MISQQIIQRVLNRAMQGSADFAEVFCEDKSAISIQYQDKKIDRMTNGHDYGLGLRLVKGVDVIYAYTSDLRERNLLRMAAEAAAAFTTKAAEGQTDHVLAFNVTKPETLSPVSIRPDTIALRRKLDYCREAHDAALEHDASISQAAAIYLEEIQNVLIANSEGLWTGDQRVRTRFAVTAVASYGGEMQTAFYGPGYSMGFEYFEKEDVKAIAREAARQAALMVRADYAPAAQMPVVLCNGFGGVLFHEACGHGLEASFISKELSVFTGKIGRQIASPLVTAIDDGRIPNAWGTLNIDDEGSPTQRNVLIENGILKSYLVDRVNGKRMGIKATGSSRRQSYRYAPVSRMNNTYIAAGKDRPEDIIADTEYGIYACSLSGGSVDITSGDFNFGVTEAYLIENGKLSKPVRGASLIGKGSEILPLIDRVGNDLELGTENCGAASGMVPVCVGQPTLRVSRMTVGGKN